MPDEPRRHTEASEWAADKPVPISEPLGPPTYIRWAAENMRKVTERSGAGPMTGDLDDK